MARVVIGRKKFLSSVMTAILLGVTINDQVEVVDKTASQQDLENPDVLCINAGGAGQRAKGNWDICRGSFFCEDDGMDGLASPERQALKTHESEIRRRFSDDAIRAILDLVVRLDSFYRRGMPVIKLRSGGYLHRAMWLMQQLIFKISAQETQALTSR